MQGSRHRTRRDAADYRQLSQLDHVLLRPGMYVGSVESILRQESIYNFETKKLEVKQVSLPEAMTRLFLEITSNGGDNVESSRRFGVDPGGIDVLMDYEWVTVRTGGEPIPVVPRNDMSDEKNCVTLIDMLFGRLLTSSNYDESVTRSGAGLNGLGASLCNAFSTHFEVTVGDPKHGRLHRSVWKNNMKELESSITRPPFVWNGKEWIDSQQGERYSGPAFVEVKWKLDFQRFGYQQYPPETFGIFAKHLIGFSLTCKIPVSFNNLKYDVSNIKDYAKLYFDEEVLKSSLVHYCWDIKGKDVCPEGIAKLKGVKLDRAVADCKEADHLPSVEIFIADTPDKGCCVSFVNGMETADGGVHTVEVYRELSSRVLGKINETLEKRASKKKRDKKPTKLNISDVRPHVSIIFSYRAPNPDYSSQSKTKLTKPKPKILFPERMMKKIDRWKLSDRLYASADAKIFRSMKKSDGRKKKHISIEKGEDANEAGGRKSAQCVLYLVEGDSATGYPKKRISLSPGGKDFGGYYPLRGKPLNVSKASSQRIAENAEIMAIKRYTGIREGVDYTVPANAATLRYGMILLTADTDDDGHHIKALIINLFHQRYPSILKRGMVAYLLTPVVRLFKGKKIMGRFTSESEFDRWVENNPRHGFRVQRYKGLGTSRDSDIKDDINTAMIVVCVCDNEVNNSLNLAFGDGKKNSDARKEWIKRWRDATGVRDIVVARGPPSVFRYQNVTNIINTDLIDYTVSTLFRAIPSYKDGLKKSQRQALDYILAKWNYGKSNARSVKVSRIAATAGERVHYQHGEVSLMDTIVGLGQNFTGSNNLNLLMQEGQFGTRSVGGKDAASGRYIETKPEWWIKYAFSKELTDTVPKRKVEGEEVEPFFIPCIIPLHVVNGALGIATGHSTYTPCHNPIDVIDWILLRCQGKFNYSLTPWYRDFEGVIKLEEKKKSRFVIEGEEKKEHDLNLLPSEEIDPDEEDEDEDEEKKVTAILKESAKGNSIMRTYGKFTITKEHGDGSVDLEITELPIGRWIHPYRKWLEKLIEEKRITDMIDRSTPERPYFIIKSFKPLKGEVNFKELKLEKSFGLNNVNLIDDNGFPYHFDSTFQVLEKYYLDMIEVFSNVIKARIRSSEEKLIDLSYRHKFILHVVEGKIVVFRQRKLAIHQSMKAFQIPFKYLDLVKLHECTYEELEKIETQIQEVSANLEMIRKQTPQKNWSDMLLVFREQLVKRGWKNSSSH